MLAPIADLTEKMSFDKSGDVSITMANQMTAMARLWKEEERRIMQALQTKNFEEAKSEDDILLQELAPFKGTCDWNHTKNERKLWEF